MEENKYTFEVARTPTGSRSRTPSRRSGVKVVRVNTLNVKPKTKRVRYVAGKTVLGRRPLSPWPRSDHRGLRHPGVIRLC
ncbi:MAG: hypothetical protein ACLTKG_08355 [Collinsella intestinalis]